MKNKNWLGSFRAASTPLCCSDLVASMGFSLPAAGWWWTRTSLRRNTCRAQQMWAILCLASLSPPQTQTQGNQREAQWHTTAGGLESVPFLLSPGQPHLRAPDRVTLAPVTTSLTTQLLTGAGLQMPLGGWVASCRAHPQALCWPEWSSLALITVCLPHSRVPCWGLWVPFSHCFILTY